MSSRNANNLSGLPVFITKSIKTAQDMPTMRPICPIYPTFSYNGGIFLAFQKTFSNTTLCKMKSPTENCCMDNECIAIHFESAKS